MEDLRHKRIVVVGASGFLGSCMARKMAHYGAEVVGASRSPRCEPPVVPYQLDASDYDAFEAFLIGVQPDYVVHLARDSRGGREVDLVRNSVKNDLLTSVNCLVACKKHGVKRYC